MIGKAALDRLRSVESGMVSDCMMRLGLSGWMDGVRPVQPGLRRAVGPARTLLFGPKRGDGAWGKSMYRTMASLSPGDVLVFATGGTAENLMGDNMALFAQMHGLAACVTDSTVRDGAGMAELTMPVYARGTAVRLPLNMEPIALDVPVFCGGTQVRPGDAVMGCEDGVVVVPGPRIDDVLFQLDEVEVCERQLGEAIRSRAPLEEIEAIVKRKKTARQR
jgi:regulator of RNase E activity RraA